MSAQTVKLEIGDNLLAAIKELLKNVDVENNRLNFTSYSPGREVKRAFGIDAALLKAVICKKG
jgi:hypothetical protein